MLQAKIWDPNAIFVWTMVSALHAKLDAAAAVPSACSLLSQITYYSTHDMKWRSVSNLYQRIEQHRYVFDAAVPSTLLYTSFTIVWINDNVMVYQAGILASTRFLLIIDSTETSAFVSLYFALPFFSYYFLLFAALNTHHGPQHCLVDIIIWI